MNGFKLLVLLLFSALGILTVAQFTTSAPPAFSETETAAVDAFLRLHQDVRNHLRTSFATQHEFVDATRDPASRRQFDWPQNSRDHLRHTLVNRQYDGQFIQRYLITFAVRQDAISESTSLNDSESMEATAILNHYLSPLGELGLACRDSPMAALGRTQYAAKTWVPNTRYTTQQTSDSPIWVEGEVFYAPKDQSITVRITIGGRHVPSGR